MQRSPRTFLIGTALLVGLAGAPQFASVASAQNLLSPSGPVGIGTSTPASMLEVSRPAQSYWVRSSNSWAGSKVPPQSLVVTNPQPGGWDTVIVGRMATSAGTLQPVFALGAIGTSNWSDTNVASQIADVYFITRDATGALQERFRIDARGYMGIGTISPTAPLHVGGNIQVDGNIAAKYQDVAEWVKADRGLPPATVVIIDPKEPNRVIASVGSYDTRVAGVVSDKPGVLLGEGSDDKAKIAHSGRVKVKVDATNAPIAVGDLLVTSGIPGVAMRSEPINVGGAQLHRPGTLIGKALEALDEGAGEILVLLTLQ
jgi:hypothetical protein